MIDGACLAHDTASLAAYRPCRNFGVVLIGPVRFGWLAGALHCRLVSSLFLGGSVGCPAHAGSFPISRHYMCTNQAHPIFSPLPSNQTASSTLPSSTSLAVSVKIDVGEGESIEQAFRRFKREVNKSGHLMELRHRRYFENSQEKKKRKIKEARMRIRMERMQRRRMNKQRA